MRKFYRKAYKKNVAVNFFESKKGVSAARAKREARKKKSYHIPDDKQDLPCKEDGSPEVENISDAEMGNQSVVNAEGSPTQNPLTALNSPSAGNNSSNKNISKNNKINLGNKGPDSDDDEAETEDLGMGLSMKVESSFIK